MFAPNPFVAVRLDWEQRGFVFPVVSFTVKHYLTPRLLMMGW